MTILCQEMNQDFLFFGRRDISGAGFLLEFCTNLKGRLIMQTLLVVIVVCEVTLMVDVASCISAKQLCDMFDIMGPIK